MLKTQKPQTKKQTVQMPWYNLTKSELKIIARANENLRELDFAAKAIKHWHNYFEGLFDKFSIPPAWVNWQ